MLSKNLRSHRFYFLISFSFLFGVSTIKAQNVTWYVTSVGAGDKLGSSWTNASNDLQMVINGAVSGDEIRVGAGEYKARNVPETNEIDTFYGKACYYIVNKNLRLFGGYPSVGGSTRNASLNRTILNADFQTHVLLAINLSAATRIDGFELRGGFANNTIDVLTVAGASISGIQGAGLYNYASSPTISNCVFASNLASREGGGVANFAGSSPSFTDCVFASNRGRGGAGYSTNNSSTTFNNCVFSENSTSKLGGAWFTDDANTQLSFTNCTFVGNLASNGGALYSVGNLTIKNSIFYNNKIFDIESPDYYSLGDGGDVVNTGGTLSIQNSMLQTNLSCPTCLSKNNKDPLFKNVSKPSGTDNKWRTADDGLALNCGSPAIDKGNSAFNMETVDVLGNPRVTASLIDLGAYESDLSYPRITVQPIDKDTCQGNPAAFSVTATGRRQLLTYQWQIFDGYYGTFNNIAGANAKMATFTIPAVDSFQSYNYYRCVVTEDCPINSDYALLTVNTVPFMVIQPVDRVACPNTNVSFKAKAQTYNEDPFWVKQQWQVNTGSGFSDIAGATDTILTLNAVSLSMNKNKYRCISRSDCGSVTSSEVTLQVSNLAVAYVDIQATGNNDGSSWADAFRSLQSALELVGCVGTIQVAQGIYTPTKDIFVDVSPPNVKDKTFFIPKDVVLLGGYPTGGGVRNATENPTILRGDVGDYRSAYHVVVTKDLTNATVIEGFTIEGGQAFLENGISETVSVGGVPVYRTRGAGVYNLSASSPTVKACKFVNNRADEGAGMYNENANMTLESCVFEGNEANRMGGIYNKNTQLTLKYGVFDNNGSQQAGAIGNIGSSQLLVYSTIFSRNRTFDKGGAIGNYDNATVRLSNCTVYHNQSSINNEGGALTIDNTIFYNNYLGSNFEDAIKTGLSTDITPNGGPLSITNSLLQHDHICTGCISTNNQNPQFRNATDPPPSGGLAGFDNIWLTADDNLQLSCGGSALNAGNNSKVIGTQDVLGNPRIQLTTVDLGAYESALNPPIITSNLTNQTLCAGATLTLSVTATGAGTIQYQWQSNRGGVFEDILGATDATYVLSNILETWNGVQVRCMVSNGFCSKPSDVSILTVNGAPTIVRQPAQLVICPLDTAIFSVSSQAFGAQTYQWQVNSGTGFVNVTGQTDSILTLFNAPPSLSGNQYRCVITSQCLSKPSESARLYFLHTTELYVDSTATGIADGSSWANAFPTLQPAIDLTKCGTVTKINVAEGTYTPSKTPPTHSIDPANPDNPQQYAFYLTYNTVLLGGYPSGGGTRNAKINRTVLSGNVGALDNQNDNTFNLLMTQGLDSTTIIDGFVFTETGYDVGAIRNDTSSPTIRNCVFLNNGRGIYNTASSPSVSDCYFEGQIQTIVNTDSSKVRIERCAFVKNGQVIINYNSNTAVNASVFDSNDSGSFSGAAVDNKGSSTATLNNCVFSNNRSQDYAVVLYNEDYGTMVVNSCTFYNNAYYNSGNVGVIVLNQNELTVRNSIFYNNSMSNRADRNYNSVGSDIVDEFSVTSTIENTMLQSPHDNCPTCPSFDNYDPQFANLNNLIGTDSIWGTADDGLRLACGGLASNTGNNIYATPKDLVGNTRIQFGKIDLGAYEGTALSAALTKQPQNDTVCLGSSATFTVAAANQTGITYQWQSDIGLGFQNMASATNATLTIPSVSVDNIGVKYRCLISKACATASETAMVVLDSLPTITLEPKPQVTCMGSGAYFSVIATSSRPITYQWQFEGGMGFQNIVGAIDSTLTLPNLGLTAVGLYRCVASNGCSAKPSKSVSLDIPTDTAYYVDANARGLNNGKTWANAFTSLQSALDRAKCPLVKSVYVAQGNYVPEKDPLEGQIVESTNETKTFYISTNIRLLGGYPTGGGARNPKLNPTVLDGQVGTNKNSKHVVILRNVNANMIFDGFTVTNGYAYGNEQNTIKWADAVLRDADGGGIACVNGTPTIRNCTFRNNETSYRGNGGAIYSTLKSPSLITDCIFERNESNGGGAIALRNGHTVIKNCFFDNNKGWHGGAIHIDTAQNATLSNCVFTANICSLQGGAVWIGQEGGAKVTINSCTFYKNATSFGSVSSAIWNSSSVLMQVANTIFSDNAYGGDDSEKPTSFIIDNSHTAHFTNCTLQQNNLTSTNCVILTNASSVGFSATNNPKGDDNIWGTSDDGLTIRCNSITLNNGNDTLVDSPTDILGRPRITFGQTDLGAYESNFDCDNYVQLATKVLLQGPFNTTSELMHDSLRVRGFIPTEEPYTALGFIQKGNGGGETVGPSVLRQSGRNTIVDWVFLELRDASDSTRVVSTRSALLQRDGDVVDTDGDSPVTFSGAPEGNYYIAIRHRNHLACRTRDTIPLYAVLDTTVNFMNGSTPIVGKNPMRAVGRFFALYAGDANHDGKVSYNGSANDRVAVLRIVGLNTVNNEYAGYYNEDVNMDGKVRYTGVANDRVLILSLVGLNTVNNIILQQY